MAQYVSGIYALNLTAPEGTPGDWHFSAINWKNIKISDTEDSVFGDYGLYSTDVPEHGEMLVANHVRACLDLIEKGYVGTAEGMREYYLEDELYTPIVFEKVWLLKDSSNWKKIDEFMKKEYLCDWLDYKAFTKTAVYPQTVTVGQLARHGGSI